MGVYTLVWVAAISCALIGVGESFPQHKFTRPSYFSFSTVHVPSSEPLKPAIVTPIEVVDSEAQADGTVKVAPEPVEETIEPVTDAAPASPTVEEVVPVDSLAQTDESFVLLETEQIAPEPLVVESVDIIPETATEVVDQVYDQEVLLDVTELPDTLISQEPAQIYVEEIYEPQIDVQPEVQVVEKVEEVIVEEPKIAKQLIGGEVIEEKPVDDMQLVIGEEPQPETEIVNVQAPEEVQVVEEQQGTSSVDPLQTDTFFRYNNFLNAWLKLASVNMKRSDLLKLVYTPGQEQTHFPSNIGTTETVETPIVQTEIIESEPEVLETEITIAESQVPLETEVTYVDVAEVIEPSADYDVAQENVDQVDTVYDSPVDTIYDSTVDQVDTVYDSPVDTIYDSTNDQVDTVYDSALDQADVVYDVPVEPVMQENFESVSKPMQDQFSHPIVEEVQQTLFEVTAQTEATLIEEDPTSLFIEEDIVTEQIPTVNEAKKQTTKTASTVLPELTEDLIQSNAIAKSISSGLNTQNSAPLQTPKVHKISPVSTFTQSTFIQGQQTPVRHQAPRHQHTFAQPPVQHHSSNIPTRHRQVAQAPARHHHVAQAPARHHQVAQAPARNHHVAQAPARHHHVAQAPARHHHVAQAPARHHHVAQAPAVHQSAARHHTFSHTPSFNKFSYSFAHVPRSFHG